MRLIQADCEQRIALAASLHGAVAGSLVACASMGEIIKLTLEQKEQPAQASEMLTLLDTSMRQALQVIRNLTEAQFPSVLKAFGLNTALQQHISDAPKLESGSVILHTTGEELPIDFDRKLNLFRMIETMLERFLIHANSSPIEIVSRTEEDRMEVSIHFKGAENPWALDNAAMEMAIIEARCLVYDIQLRTSKLDVPDGVTYSFTVRHPR